MQQILYAEKTIGNGLQRTAVEIHNECLLRALMICLMLHAAPVALAGCATIVD
jgi:hypothetical protein